MQKFCDGRLLFFELEAFDGVSVFFLLDQGLHEAEQLVDQLLVVKLTLAFQHGLSDLE